MPMPVCPSQKLYPLCISFFINLGFWLCISLYRHVHMWWKNHRKPICQSYCKSTVKSIYVTCGFTLSEVKSMWKSSAACGLDLFSSHPCGRYCNPLQILCARIRSISAMCALTLMWHQFSPNLCQTWHHCINKLPQCIKGGVQVNIKNQKCAAGAYKNLKKKSYSPFNSLRMSRERHVTTEDTDCSGRTPTTEDGRQRWTNGEYVAY